MEFLGTLIFYSLEFIFIAAVAVGGVFVGKKLRERKDAKAAKADKAE